MKKLKTKYIGVYKSKQSRDGRGVPYKKKKNRKKESKAISQIPRQPLPNPVLSVLHRFESQIPGFLDISDDGRINS